MLKRFLFFISFLFISNLSYSNDNNQLLLNELPKKIRDLSLTGLNGSKKKISNYTSKVVILNFWATWCPPCIKEIPDLLKLQKLHKDSLSVLFISLDSNPDKVIHKFLKKNKFSNIEIFLDSQLKISDELNVKLLPTSIIIDKKLMEVSRTQGYIEWLSDNNTNIIKKLFLKQ